MKPGVVRGDHRRHGVDHLRRAPASTWSPARPGRVPGRRRTRSLSPAPMTWRSWRMFLTQCARCHCAEAHSPASPPAQPGSRCQSGSTSSGMPVDVRLVDHRRAWPFRSATLPRRPARAACEPVGRLTGNPDERLQFRHTTKEHAVGIVLLQEILPNQARRTTLAASRPALSSGRTAPVTAPLPAQIPRPRPGRARRWACTGCWSPPACCPRPPGGWTRGRRSGPTRCGSGCAG